MTKGGAQPFVLRPVDNAFQTGSQSIQALAPHLPPDLLIEALAIARAICHDDWMRAEVILTLVPHLPPGLLTEVLVIVRTIGDEDMRDQTLRALAKHQALSISNTSAECSTLWHTTMRRSPAVSSARPSLPTAKPGGVEYVIDEHVRVLHPRPQRSPAPASSPAPLPRPPRRSPRRVGHG
jgi:hypothetical protein